MRSSASHPIRWYLLVEAVTFAAAAAFALLGTLVGLFTIAIGIGPRTVPDVVYHIAIVLVLIRGLVVARRGAPSA